MARADVGKQYNREYFDTWYRRPRSRVRDADELLRTVRFALHTAEYFLGRTVRNVLDVGCGEGAWRPVLRRLRPGLRYTGVDPSEYAVARFGKRRHLRVGNVARFAALRLPGRFDLVVCSDVLHYLPDGDLRAGLPAIARRVRGVAFLHVFTSDDRIAGDTRDWIARTPARYLSLFRQAGLLPYAPHCCIRKGVAGA